MNKSGQQVAEAIAAENQRGQSSPVIGKSLGLKRNVKSAGHTPPLF